MRRPSLPAPLVDVARVPAGVSFDQVVPFPDAACDEPIRIPGATPDEALSIGEFYDRVKFALRAEFPGELWVTGEIRKVTIRNGNRYLELADRHGSDRAGSAALDVACWSRDWPLIGAELQAVGLELTAGLVVRLRGRAQVWEAAPACALR